MSNTPKVLIVEDEPIIARDIQLRLVNSGFDVTGTALSAADAFKRIEEIAPDLVLMDIEINGEMDGVDAAHIIREKYSLPVIFMTAHTDDTTLQRAQLTEPYGYIVKPLGKTNLKAVATMALHKHQMECELESHRKMLSTILDGLPDAIIVADVSGEVLFLNRAAENLTGWTHQEATGKSLLNVAPIEDSSGHIVSSELLKQAVIQVGVVRIPRDSALVTKNRGAIDVSGQLSVTAVGNRPAGIFFALQDVTVQKQEDQRLSQEQQLFVAGELAQGLAREFYGLFDLIDDCASEVGEGAVKPELELLQRASQIGKRMSVQLMDFRESFGATHAINVGQYLLGSQSLLERFCGRSLRIEVSAVSDAGYVLSTGGHFEQLLMHLALDGKHRVGGTGKIDVRADVQTRPLSLSRYRAYVRLSATATKGSDEPFSGAGVDPFPFDAEQPNLNMPLIRAIVMASGGFTEVSEPSEAVSTVEVFLPRYESRLAAKAAANEYQRIVLGIGLEARLLEAVQTAAGEDALLLEATTLGEASLIAELFPGDIDLIVVNDSEALPKTRGRACDRLRARRPNAEFLQICSSGENSGPDRLSPAGLARQIAEFFDRRSLRAIASAS
jgi:two-component system, cell cycle sensor histidine kinase and response regulator CckA